VLKALVDSLRALADELAELDQDHSHITAVADKVAVTLGSLAEG
jgi:hypothetical protein